MYHDTGQSSHSDRLNILKIFILFVAENSLVLIFGSHLCNFSAGLGVPVEFRQLGERGSVLTRSRARWCVPSWPAGANQQLLCPGETPLTPRDAGTGTQWERGAWKSIILKRGAGNNQQ